MMLCPLDAFVKRRKRPEHSAVPKRSVPSSSGQRLQTVSDTLHYLFALHKWVYRFAHQGVTGLVDRPRSGRPRR